MAHCSLLEPLPPPPNPPPPHRSLHPQRARGCSRGISRVPASPSPGSAERAARSRFWRSRALAGVGGTASPIRGRWALAVWDRGRPSSCCRGHPVWRAQGASRKHAGNEQPEMKYTRWAAKGARRPGRRAGKLTSGETRERGRQVAGPVLQRGARRWPARRRQVLGGWPAEPAIRARGKGWDGPAETEFLMDVDV